MIRVIKFSKGEYEVKVNGLKFYGDTIEQALDYYTDFMERATGDFNGFSD
jgi:hypothetical protein